MSKYEDHVEPAIDDAKLEAQGSRDVSRRGFLKGIGGTGAAAAAASFGLGSTLLVAESAEAEVVGPLNPKERRYEAFYVRRDAAKDYLDDPYTQQDCNGDEALYADLRGTFSKALPHDNLGEVDLGAYQTLRDALESGDPGDFELIQLSPVADRKLANPQAAYAFEMTGRDSHDTRIPPAPKFASALQAAEMGEVYWQALTRDIPYRNWATSGDIADAVADLNHNFSQTVGPKIGGLVTPGTIFRGETPGDLVGPYISQFLWQQVPYGLAKIEQQYLFPQPGIDFMTDYNEWLAIQRGQNPVNPITFEHVPRYVYSNRALGEYVHQDVTFEAYFNAALIMFSYGPAALDTQNPYLSSATQGGFVTFGLADIADMVTKAANVALKGAWWHKWLVHRRLRPEVFCGRIENQANGSKNYGIHPDILNSKAVAITQEINGIALLPMAFPEGSPTHPSYPAGHASNAGACATILKAFFNEDFIIPNPVVASADGLSLDPYIGVAALTLGGEINKLANNISLGRDAAGVHYRSDGVDGLEVGEQQAIGMLRDYSRGYNEKFAGFQLKRFDGQKIVIVDGKVFEI